MSDSAMPPPPPLGLPPGSVRALLTLLIVAVVIVETARGRDVPLLWTETLLIVLAHYFTSRRFVQLDPQVIRRLEADGHLERESNPLFLPRHSIRAIVVLAFAALAVFLYQKQRLLRPEALALLGTVGAYLVGVLVRPISDRWSKREPGKSVWRWENLKAIAVLLALSMTAAAYLFDQAALVPPVVRNIALGFVLFYFGSR